MAPAASKTPSKRKAPPPESTSKNKKPKPPNFTSLEDVLLCKAFVNVSTNPVTGVGQKSADFWDCVKEKFDELFKEEDVPADGVAVVVNRDSSSLMNRFKRFIQLKMNVFNKYFKRMKEEGPSGTPYTEYVSLALKAYAKFEKKPFPYEDCIPILNQMPKFFPMTKAEKAAKRAAIPDAVFEDDDSDTESSPVNEIGAPMGASMPRPIGSKAAKKRIKEEHSNAAFDTKRINAMEQLVATHGELASQLKRSNDLSEAKNKEESLFRQFEMLRSMGDMEQAAECYEEIKRLRLSSSQQEAPAEEPGDSSVPIEIADTLDTMDAEVPGVAAMGDSTGDSSDVESVTPI